MLPLILLASLSAPFPAAGPVLTVGRWQAWLESPGGQLSFGLELAEEGDSWKAWLVNGAERIPVPRTTWDGEILGLHIEHYDAVIEARLEAVDGGPARLTGAWVKRTGAETRAELPFHATRSPGEPDPEPAHEPAPSSATGGDALDGRWRVDFESDEQPAVAIFGSVEGQLRGTFLTTTGDYRYLAGSLDDEGRLVLSCFDGAHAFLFKARHDASRDTLSGDFWSRDVWHETWTAVRDDEVALPDGFALTQRTGKGSLAELSFPDLDGTLRSLDDEAFAGRARILQVFGSWCPNCHDASHYLVELHRRYADRGLSIVGLAFEVSGEFERDARQVRRYAERHGVTYPLLIAGLSDKAAAGEALPIIDEVRSYPTTIFLHGDGRVRAVYQGFSGPATGSDYDTLRAAFESIIEELLAESPGG